MSFVYGGVDTLDLPGVTATLRTWPSLGGLSIDTTSVPGADGVVYGGASRSSVVFTFQVDITGDTPAEVFSRRDHFVGIIDPSRGPRDLIVENEPGWIYPDVLASTDISWDRVVWRDGLGLILRGDVVFETVGAASAREIEPTAYDSTGVVEFTATRGNTASYPTIMLPSGGDLVLQINDFELQLNGTPDGLTAALDYDSFRFDLLDPDGNRVESLVPYMQHYDRPKILPGQQVTARAGLIGHITHEWTGEPHASESVKLVNGVEVARNTVPNPQAENGTYGWSGTDLVASSNSHNTRMFGGYNDHIFYVRSTSNYPDMRSTILPIEPGQYLGVHALAATEHDQPIRIQIHWLQDGSTFAYGFRGWSQDAEFYGGKLFIETHQAPQGADGYRIQIQLDNTETQDNPRLWVREVMGVIADSEQEALDKAETYFDGDSPDLYEIMPEPMALYPNYRRI